MKFTDEDLDSENTWQVGTGDDTRKYDEVFFRFGIACVGPGDPGKEGLPETEERYRLNPNVLNWGVKLKSVQKDHWIIARKGKGIIVAVGQVVEEYNYSGLFDDIEGWDLQHFVRVKWYQPITEDKVIYLDNYCLGQSTLLGCYKQEVYDAIYNTEFEEIISSIDLDQVKTKSLSIDDIVDAIIEKGLRIQDAENIGLTLKRIIRLADWYKNYDDCALEIESVVFLVIPFLIALGWSEQKIKLEYRKIDVAIFSEPFMGDWDTSPQIIVEAKQFGNGLAFTNNQIKSYGELFPDCKQFLVTNGFRYKYFEKEDGTLICKGYFNLSKLKEKDIVHGYPLSTIETMLKISNFH